MSAITRKTMELLDGLDETYQLSVLKFVEFLVSESEDDEDVAAFDEALANDDAYRITHDDLRAKYGL